MIKLLLSAFSEFPNNNTGGANKIIYQILNGIDFSKYQVEYLSKHFYKEFNGDENIDSQIKNSLPTLKQTGSLLFRKSGLYRKIVSNPIYFGKHLGSINKFYKKITLKHEYDILHCHDTRAMYYLRKNRFRKKILTIHSNGSIIHTLKNYIGSSSVIDRLCEEYLYAENESLEIADIITFPSFAARDQFVNEKAELKIDCGKIKVVYNGVDTHMINDILPDETFISDYYLNDECDIKILNVADHVKNKNIDIVIDSIHHLKKKYNIRANLYNIGNGPETKQLIKKCKKMNLSSQVKFIGRLPSTDIIKYLKTTDMLISAADNVVFDMIILEALASGTVIIASNRGGNAEAIQNGFNGYLVEKLTGEAFADTIMQRDKNINCNAKATSNKFDLSNMIKEYEKYYNT
jgi:glycosyltransferase involved in cell wall biosynthesis